MFYIIPVLFFLGKYSQKVMKTLPTIPQKKKKKPQSTQERGNTRNKMERPTSPRRQMNHPLWEGQTTRGTSSSRTPFSCERSISTKERGGPPKRTPSLAKPSPIATACLKTKIA